MSWSLLAVSDIPTVCQRLPAALTPDKVNWSLMRYVRLKILCEHTCKLDLRIFSLCLHIHCVFSITCLYVILLFSLFLSRNLDSKYLTFLSWIFNHNQYWLTIRWFAFNVVISTLDWKPNLYQIFSFVNFHLLFHFLAAFYIPIFIPFFPI